MTRICAVWADGMHEARDVDAEEAGTSTEPAASVCLARFPGGATSVLVHVGYMPLTGLPRYAEDWTVVDASYARYQTAGHPLYLN